MLNAPISPTDDTPRPFGRYRLLRKLGEGGMGVVYLAHDPEMKRDVALKTPFVTAQDGPEILQRFRQTAQAVASLVHPNICPVYEAGTIDGVPYLTMAFIEGATLAQYLRANGPPPVGEAAALVRKLALALEEAHRCDVIHRDVKPSNVMLNRQREPILMDFGLARRVTEQTRLTRSRAMIGTPVYMAPEHVSGESGGLFDPAADVYSLGVVLYELLTGRPPFDGPNEAVVFAQILTQTPPPPSALRPDLDPRLEAVCLRAMSRDPAGRYPGMAAFAAALAPFGVETPLSNSAPQNPYSVEPPPGDESWSLPLSVSGEAARPPAPPAPASPLPTPAGRGSSRWAWTTVAVLGGLGLAVAVLFLGYQLMAAVLYSGPGPGATAQPTNPAPGSVSPNPDPTPIQQETEAERQFRLGVEALQQRQYAQAGKSFTEAVRIDPKYARAFYDRGRLFTIQGDDDAALADFTAAVRIDPDYAEAYGGRAVAYFVKNDCEEAVRDATDALRRQPLFPQALQIRGLAYFRQGKDDLAAADFSDALRLFQKNDPLTPPIFAQDYADRAAFYLQVDEFEKAVADGRAAVQTDPDQAVGYLRLAEAYHDEGKRDDEIAACTDGWKANRPGVASDHVLRAKMALVLDRPADAVAECDAAVKMDPQQAKAYEARARAWRRQGDKPRALADYAEAARLSPVRNVRDYLDRAGLYQSAEKYDLGLADADHALELAPRLPAALKKRGELFLQQNDPARCTADYKRALALWTPHYAQDFLDRAYVYDEPPIADYPSGAADCDKALHLGLKSAQVYKELGYADTLLNSYEPAQQALDEGIRLDPADPALHRFRGELSQRRMDYGEAINQYTQALAFDPNDALSYRYRGDAHKQRSEDDDAIDDYTKAIALDPKEPRSYLKRANAYCERNHPDDFRDAIRDCDRALELIPESDHSTLADAYDTRGVAHSRGKEYAEAVNDYTEAIKHDPKDPVLYRNRAAAHEKNGDDEEAAADQKMARQLEDMKQP